MKVKDMTVTACERCDKADHCRFLNPYLCNNSYTPAQDTNFPHEGMMYGMLGESGLVKAYPI
jgi:hypothetical protein